MMDIPFFSIIVPIYNVEEYLPASIKSVLSQSFKNYELILVDDGSSDKCPQICNEYAARYPQVQAIHKVNGGASDARNAGMAVSRGKYIVFLDSDDLMKDGILQRTYEVLSRNGFPQLLIGNRLNLKDNQTYYSFTFDPNKINQQDIFKVLDDFVQTSSNIPWNVYQSIYANDFLKNNGILFNREIVAAEDLDFFMKVVKNVSSFVITDLDLVIYREERDGSIINTPKFGSVYGQLEVFADTFDFFVARHDKVLIQYFAKCYTNIIVLISYLSDTDQAKCVDYITKHNYILKHCGINLKYLLSRGVWAILGFKKGSKFLNTIRH